ncbi:hypothetical protein GKA74_24350 [Vibrio parahaemolyticus]|nr:hypothetical protein [Vibrio parahaemolyticus]NVJ66304.1 hypothetical protein [Gammaproteobacteria bacterium]EGQ8699744.1 hypothetical protein [Vibrio parahaemolyticus]EGQ8754623.1 hypothetical protein [Vibrio parahaemolyticus]EGQ8759353.1 hypothetical protein [Vibrio parahaemolyticus]
MLRVKLTRDSVCMGDDCDAPHFLELELSNDSNIQNLVDAVDAKSYLAKVAGLGHLWLLLVNDKQVVALKGNSMKVRENGDVCLSLLAVDGTLNVHFKYLSSRT